MKLSDYAKKLGISYKTAWRYWKNGKLDAFQTHTGTVIVNDNWVRNQFARGSLDKNKNNLTEVEK